MSFRQRSLAFVVGFLLVLSPFVRASEQQNATDQQKPDEQRQPTEQANQGNQGQKTNQAGSSGKDNNATPETGKTDGMTNNPQQAGMDRPSIVVRADEDEVETTIKLRGLDGKPEAGDFELGRIEMPQHPIWLRYPA